MYSTCVDPTFREECFDERMVEVVHSPGQVEVQVVGVLGDEPRHGVRHGAGVVLDSRKS